LLASLHSARADLILLGEAAFSAQGFGNANRLITVQAQGNETGSVFPLNGTVGGSGDVVSPLADNQKFGVPTLGQLGWTTASQIELLFNATEPGGNSVTIDHLTLSFYNGNNSFFSISNAQPITIANTVTGNGSAGFLFGISPSELGDVNSHVFSLANASNFRIGISTSISDVAGGPESFNAVSATPAAVPGPIAGAGIPGLIAAFGGVLGWYRRRRKPVAA